MKCKHPFVTKSSHGIPISCGQCLQCRIDNRRVKTHRMMLEASSHIHNSFLTVTYNDDNLPDDFYHNKTGQIFAPNSVNPEHHRLFINNLRTKFFRKTGQTLRYYACGEYGENTQRPHYHYALFGYPTCLNLSDRQKTKSFTPCDCANCDFITKVWGKGHIFLGGLTQESAQYIAGYVTKKLTSPNCRCKGDQHHPTCSQVKLNGRYPEFGRQSLKPALGRTAYLAHLKKIKHHIKEIDDIPRILVHNGKKWPIGRYLYDEAIKYLGLIKDEETKTTTERKNHDKVLLMFKDKTLTKEAQEYLNAGLPELALELLNKQQSLQLETKQNFYILNKKGI